MSRYPHAPLVLFAGQEARFWALVERRDDDECWPWGGVVSGIRPTFAVRLKDGSMRAANSSRVAFYYAYGEDPGELLVCHRCDVGRCCNPAHLFSGTTQDNARDAALKGRISSGIIPLPTETVRLPPPDRAFRLPGIGEFRYWSEQGEVA